MPDDPDDDFDISDKDFDIIDPAIAVERAPILALVVVAILAVIAWWRPMA